ncbi:MAG: response regulator [Deltaproteobacteria bacterium]|nr:response regulator [Deltaproteobacteria bacterium]
MAKILIVDDHAPTREHLLERLHAEGHSPVGLQSAAEGFEALAESDFAAALISLALPPHEGEHLARKLRRAEAGVPVIILDIGHRGAPRGVQAILELGAHGYVPDPTDHKAVMGRLAPLLAKAERDAEERRAATPQGPAAGAAAEATVESGELEPGRMPTLLLACRAARRSGALRLIDEGAERTIYLLEGAPVGFRSSLRRENLGPWLVERGRIDEATYQSSLEVMAGEGLSQTAALVAVGALEGGAPVYDLLIEHASDQLVRALTLRQGRYRIVESLELAREVPALELDLLPLLRQAARESYPVRFFHERLGEQMVRYPYRTGTFGAELKAMGLSAKELAYAMKITGEVSTRELVEQARGELKEALLLLWFFDAVGVLRYSDAQHRSEDSGTYRAAPRVGRTLKPLPAELRADLTEEALSIVTASYFGALGLDITANADSVEMAYHELATRFHPESYPENDLTDVEDLFQTVQDKVGAAYRVLSVPEKRKAYLNFLLSRQEVKHRRGPVNIEAEILLRRGINAIAAMDWTGAERAFQEAASLNPREPEYHCYLAFASYKAGRGAAAERARGPRKVLQKALSLDPGMEQALVLLGIIEQECGDDRSARRRFLDVLKANPRSVTAKAALQRLNRVVPKDQR